MHHCTLAHGAATINPTIPHAQREKPHQQNSHTHTHTSCYYTLFYERKEKDMRKRNESIIELMTDHDCGINLYVCIYVVLAQTQTQARDYNDISS